MDEESKRTTRGGHEGCLVVKKSQLKSYDTLGWCVSLDLENTTLRLLTYALIVRTLIDSERSEKKITVHYDCY